MSNISALEQRFIIRRQVGAGGMGVVFEAYDKERRQTVAIKTLRHSDSSALYRLKREFRSLADVVHPNLVPLFELIGERSEWFFTMEFVDGVDFLTYVRSSAPPEPQSGVQTNDSTRSQPDAVTTEPRPGWRRVAQMNSLRSALRQLAEGVCALHSYGKIHRDLKPSNVLVRRDGRVVILDFGLVADLRVLEDNRGVTFGGTPRYMSPEQITNHPITSASDWYSVGVMLYEALTGALPNRGDIFSMPSGPARELTPPQEINPSAPRDLSDLTMELLALDPRRRPSDSEVLRKIGAPATESWSHHAAGSLFIGRADEIRRLWEAYERVQDGSPVTVLVHGASGMGKTSLVQHFVAGVLEREQDIVILRGRCYEQESVPFKALDSLIDDLRSYAKHLTPLELKAITPTDVASLARIFPVLEPLESTSKRRRSSDAPDSQESRRRGFGALREMLTRIADTHPLVLFFDDVQWGDRDSAAVLSELLGPPDPPAALVLLSYRTSEQGLGPFVADVNRLRAGAALGTVIDLPVPALTEEEATELARAIGGISLEAARVIARASAGSPLFVSEMSHLAASLDDRRAATVDDLIRTRVQRLPDAARHVLEVVAVAGQPIERSVIEAAAESSDPEALLTLRAHHLVRSRTVQGREEIVSHHDRFREAIVAGLSDADRKNLHRRLAVALQNADDRDPELLATHFARAGDSAIAATHAIEAAEKAMDTFAFDHAARLYRLVLELDPSISTANEIRVRLADALANAGRTGEAGPVYLRAAEEADSRTALDLRRRAAESFLRGGHVDEGLKAVREVLAAVGMQLPRTPARALTGILWRRALLAFHGMKARREEANHPELLLTIDILWSVIIGLARIDNIRSVYFQPTHLRLALDSGDGYRIARALIVEAGFAGTRGGPGRKRALALVDRTAEHARRVGHPHAIGLSYLAASVADFYVGDFRRSFESAKQAEEIFRERCTGVVWEINTAQNYQLSSLTYLGEIDELAERVPKQLREARDRGDLYAATDVAGRAGIVWLALDDPEQARFAITRAMEQWSLEGFHFQHFVDLYANTQIDLYLGDSASALARMNQRWQALKESMLLRIQFNRIEALHLRARCAVAEAKRTGDHALRRIAESDAKHIDREKMRWARPLAQSVLGACAAQRGQQEKAADALRAAIRGFDRVQMALYAAAARWQLGALTGGENGLELKNEAEYYMASQNVRRPETLVKLLIPGF